MKSGIYGWRCMITGKWYVGQSIDIEKRKREHLLFLNRGTHYNNHLQSAFNKYGKISFEFQVLEVTNKDMLDLREKSWIGYLKADNREFGYNNESGGNINKNVSESTRAKISASKMGKHPTLETRARMSASRKGNPKMSLAQMGKHPSLETRKKLSLMRIGKKPSAETRAKLSKWQIGRTLSAEHRAKISLGRRGQRHREEAKKEKIGLREFI